MSEDGSTRLHPCPPYTHRIHHPHHIRSLHRNRSLPHLCSSSCHPAEIKIQERSLTAREGHLHPTVLPVPCGGHPHSAVLLVPRFFSEIQEFILDIPGCAVKFDLRPGIALLQHRHFKTAPDRSDPLRIRAGLAAYRHCIIRFRPLRGLSRSRRAGG